MKHSIIILEFFLIILYIDTTYVGTTHYQYNYTSMKEHFTAYYELDVVNNETIVLNNLSEAKKLEIWKSSALQETVLEFFPDIETMKEVYNNSVSDNGLFKEKFFNHIEAIQNAYIAGEIDEEEFKKAFLNPPF